MADDYAEHLRQHDEILRSLTAMLVEQREMNHHFGDLFRQQVAINQDVNTTLARIETLLARMIRHEDNGREA